MLRFVPAAAVLIALPFSAAAGNPPFSFFTRTDLTGPACVAVVSADFNGDGIADLAVLGGVSLEVYLGEGNRRFAPPISAHLNGEQSYDALAVADINGDGQPDLVVSGANTQIFYGNGNGTFTPGPTLAVAGLPVVAADFNLDGNRDLAFASSNGISVVLGNGKGGFTPPVVLPAAGGCLAVGDVNGDGYPDVIGCGVNSLVVFLGDGNGAFQSPIGSPIPSSAIFATTGDLNNDGKLDVAAVANHENGSNSNLGPVYVLYGNGDGSFQPALQVHTNIGPLFAVGIGDLNGDGLQDLVAASIGGLPGAPFSGSLVGTYLNRGPGKGFAQDQAYPVTFADELPWAVLLVTDLSGGLNPDIVVTNGGGDAYFSVLFNDGTGGFKDVQDVNNLPGYSLAAALYGTPASVLQADFNGDGLPDLAFITVRNGAYELQVFFGTGKSQPFAPGPASLLISTSASFEPISMVAGDFNGDGKLDVAVSYANELATVSFVQVYLGNGDGTFSAGGTLSVPMAAVQMIAADFNGDGNLDLASSSGFLALGNGDGTFQEATVFYRVSPDANTFGVWLGSADFNHDGKLDLAFQTPQLAGVGQPLLIFAGNGDGTFQNPVSYTWGQLPADGAIADLNGDGNPDILILSSANGNEQNTVAVFLGNSDGTFQPPAYLKVRYSLSAIQILAGDFNGDGKVDVAVMDSGGNAVHFFAGNGDGAFGPDVEFGAASTMEWMGSGNYAGQTKPGYPDLVFFDGGPNSFLTPPNAGGLAISMLWNSGWKHRE
jgi:hypothetical protein